jgi:hypothetical protein
MKKIISAGISQIRAPDPKIHGVQTNRKTKMKSFEIIPGIILDFFDLTEQWT